MVDIILKMEVAVYILSQEEILNNLGMFQTKIDNPLTDESAQIMEQLTEAENIMVNSGKMLADAKYHFNNAMRTNPINL